MNNREIIYESLIIIEENLRSDLNIQGISEKLGFSVYYFSRLFKAITGISPKNYLQKRRITQAFKDLQQDNKKIIEIAFDYGFGSPESFSRAFYKILGINPGTVKSGNSIDMTALQYPLTPEKLEHFRKIPNREPELVDFGPLHLIGLPFYYEEAFPKDLSNPWQSLTENSDLITNRVQPERFYQLQYWFAHQDPGSIFFFVALEVENFDSIPMQFTAKTLPAQKYLRFYHKGLSNQVGYTYQYIYEEYLPETNYKLPHLFNFEYYPPEHKGPYNEESVSEIYIPVSL